MQTFFSVVLNSTSKVKKPHIHNRPPGCWMGGSIDQPMLLVGLSVRGLSQVVAVTSSIALGEITMRAPCTQSSNRRIEPISNPKKWAERGAPGFNLAIRRTKCVKRSSCLSRWRACSADSKGQRAWLEEHLFKSLRHQSPLFSTRETKRYEKAQGCVCSMQEKYKTQAGSERVIAPNTLQKSQELTNKIDIVDAPPNQR